MSEDTARTPDPVLEAQRSENERLRRLLQEVYHAMIRAGWRDGYIMERVRQAKWEDEIKEEVAVS